MGSLKRLLIKPDASAGFQNYTAVPRFLESLKTMRKPKKVREPGARLRWVCPECNARLGVWPEIGHAEAMERLRRHNKERHSNPSPQRGSRAGETPRAVAAIRFVASPPAQRATRVLQRCPECGVPVRENRFQRHRSRMHAAESAQEPSRAEEVPVERFSFELLPPGTWDIDDVIAYYQREAHRIPTDLAGREIQWTRLKALKSLNPTKCYVGTELWLGYVLFEFSRSSRVVLECPVYGNATYVLSGNWKKMVGHTKRYIRKFSPGCRKIVHTGKWLARITTAAQLNGA